MNLVILKGNLTDIPQLKAVGQYNTALATFTIAVNEKYKDKEDTHFINCKAFGKTAENIGKYFTKGKPILIEGNLNQETWEREGRKYSRITVLVRGFDFVGTSAAKEGTEKSPNNEIW